MAKAEWLCDKDGCVKVATYVEKERRPHHLTRDQFCDDHINWGMTQTRKRAGDFKSLPPRIRE